MRFEFRQIRKELYSAEFIIVDERENVYGHAHFEGNMTSVFGNWRIEMSATQIRLDRIHANQALSLTGGLTKDKPFGAMEIFVDGISRGVVFQGTHKKSLFKEYSIHHIIYDRQVMYRLYPIGFGKEGSKSPIYLETPYENAQVGQIEKDSIVYDDLHVFRCYLLDPKDMLTAVIFSALMYSMGCYKPGVKITSGVKQTSSTTLEEELLSKYDPNFLYRIGE